MKKLKWILVTAILIIPVVTLTVIEFLAAWMSWHIEDALSFVENKALDAKDYLINLMVKIAPWPWG